MRHPSRAAVQDILFYSLPAHGQYYAEVVNLLEGGGSGSAATAAAAAATVGSPHATVTALFCRYDLMLLERVVGSARARRMCAKAAAPTFMFC